VIAGDQSLIVRDQRLGANDEKVVAGGEAFATESHGSSIRANGLPLNTEPTAMYFEDLSPYSYWHVTFSNVRNVGWLDFRHWNAKGWIARELVAKLKVLAATCSVRQARGFHGCFPCFYRSPKYFKHQSVRHLLGSNEIWIPDITRERAYFAAPDLIIHYIDWHWYRPPKVYLDSLHAVDLATWRPDDGLFARARLEDIDVTMKR